MVALAHPLRGNPPVSSPFGSRPSRGDFHTGVDWGVPVGTPVYAAASGRARRATNPGGGWGVVIEHNDGTETGYWHLNSRAISFSGQPVVTGQLIGWSGASGVVTGPHLHFEYKVNGQAVDPLVALMGGVGNPTGNVQPIPDGEPGAFPLDEGMACPPGYARGTVNPRFHGAVPFNIWFNRPTNADGTVNACVRVGLDPGDNVATADVGYQFGKWFVEDGLPLLLNISVVVAGGLLLLGGAQRVIGVEVSGPFGIAVRPR